MQLRHWLWNAIRRRTSSTSRRGRARAATAPRRKPATAFAMSGAWAIIAHQPLFQRRAVIGGGGPAAVQGPSSRRRLSEYGSCLSPSLCFFFDTHQNLIVRRRFHGEGPDRRLRQRTGGRAVSQVEPRAMHGTKQGMAAHLAAFKRGLIVRTAVLDGVKLTRAAADQDRNTVNVERLVALLGHVIEAADSEIRIPSGPCAVERVFGRAQSRRFQTGIDPRVHSASTDRSG